jgi:trimethyllysine dioxygenase
LQNNLIKKDNKNQKIFLWKNEDLNSQVYLNYSDVLSKDGFKSFLKCLYEYGFCVLTNCETSLKSVETIANKIGYVRESIFGGLWEFESNENMADSAYTQEELRPHTDSTYSNDAPGLQLLLCCDYSASGGESIMVDGFKIAEKLKKEKEIFDILSSIEVPGRYVGDGVILESSRPIFRLNSKKELLQVSFNNYDRAEFRIENELMIKFYDAIKKFDNLANKSEFQWRHILKPGELLIFNNWRILHGRGSFKGKRKMSGCYINMEDFESICKINKLY